MELYVCKYADAHGSDGTLQAHEVDHKPYVYTTVGFLIKTDDVGISIGMERGEDNKYRDITFVPRAIVIEEFSLGKLKHPRQKRKTLKTTVPDHPSQDPAIHK